MNLEEIKVGKLVYLGEWPPEMLSAVREVVDPLEWIAPAWANQICISYNDKNECSIDCSIEYDYRRVRLCFYPPFLLTNAEDRRYMVLHDLLHGFSCVLSDYARDTITTLLPDGESPKFREHALRELTMRHEQWTQDLAFCLLKKL